VHEDVGLGRPQPGHPLLGLRQQGPGLPAAQGGEVDAGDRPVAPGQRRAGGQGDGVQPGRGAAEGAQAAGRAVGRDGAAPLHPLDQDRGWVAVQVGGEKPRRRQVVAGGQSERGHLGAQARTVLVAADPQDDAALAAAAAEPDQPGRAAVTQAADRDDLRPRSGGPDGPVQQPGIQRWHGRRCYRLTRTVRRAAAGGGPPRTRPRAPHRPWREPYDLRQGVGERERGLSPWRCRRGRPAERRRPGSPV
jgi:hypothetical protein